MLYKFPCLWKRIYQVNGIILFEEGHYEIQKNRMLIFFQNMGSMVKNPEREQKETLGI